MSGNSDKSEHSSKQTTEMSLYKRAICQIFSSFIITLNGRHHIYAKKLLSIIWSMTLMVVLLGCFGNAEGLHDLTNGHKESITESKDYCVRDTAKLQCDRNQIITVTSAYYGRMRKDSHCISSDYDRVCTIEVTKLLDKFCSGKYNCTIVVKMLIDLYQPCGDLTSYLSIAFKCTPVISPLHCREEIPLRRDAGFIPYPSALLFTLGTSSCPWRLQAKPQQQIKIYLKSITRLVDLATNPNGGGILGGTMFGGGVDGTNKCSQDIVFKEVKVLREKEGGGRSEDEGSSITQRQHLSPSVKMSETKEEVVDICEKENAQSHVLLYESQTPRVEMYFPQPMKSVQNVLLYYEVIGCPEFNAPPGGWVQQDKGTARIHCNNTRETWYLTCKGTQWNGATGNCTLGSLPNITENESSRPLPFSIVMAVFLGVIIGVVFGILMLFFVYMWYKREHKSDYADPHNMNTSYYTTDGKDLSNYATTDTSAIHRQINLNHSGGGGGDYTTYQLHTHSSTCPSHPNSQSVYGKYMGILPASPHHAHHHHHPQQPQTITNDSSTALLTSSTINCPYSTKSEVFRAADLHSTPDVAQHNVLPATGCDGRRGAAKKLPLFYDSTTPHDKL